MSLLKLKITNEKDLDLIKELSKIIKERSEKGLDVELIQKKLDRECHRVLDLWKKRKAK